MASPTQHRGSCGHIMARFDNHTKCTRCREKGIGKGVCVKGQECGLCEELGNRSVQNLLPHSTRSVKTKNLGY